jgi:hypothetical protein
MSKPRDPIGFELFKNTLLSIADEMALTILAHRLLRRAQGQHGLLDILLRRERADHRARG